MTKTVCDRCKRIVEYKDERAVYLSDDQTVNSPLCNSKKIDLCPVCYEKIILWIEGADCKL